MLLRPLLCLAAASLLIAGCGSDDPQKTSTAADDADTARLKLQNCMRENGVTPGAGSPSSVDPDKLEKAMEACKEYREAARGEITPEQREEFRDAFVKFSSCMRGEGVDLPDPTTSGGGGLVGARRAIDLSDPKVREAMEACEDALPAGARGGRPGVQR